MYWLRIALFSILDREEAGSNNYIIARYLLENYNELPGVSLTEISRQCSLSKAAVSRFCKELGLMDYIDLQMLIRSSQKKEKKKESIPVDAQKEQFYTQMDDYIGSFKASMDQTKVEELITDIGRYRTMYAFGHLQASHIAYTLGNNMAMNDIFCFCTQSWTEQTEIIRNASSDALIIVFSASGDYFKRMDLNMHFLDKADAPKVYMVTFSDGKPPHEKLNIIRLGGENRDLLSNLSMNMFVNYLSFRVRNT